MSDECDHGGNPSDGPCVNCAADEDETPPWHEYDGCYGCRKADALNRKRAREAQS